MLIAQLWKLIVRQPERNHWKVTLFMVSSGANKNFDLVQNCREWDLRKNWINLLPGINGNISKNFEAKQK